MKIKRKIKALLCVLALMGIISLDVLSAQAAMCSHKFCYMFNDVKIYFYESDGHYGECGTSYICADCGYQYWGDDLEIRKIGDHEWELSERIVFDDGTVHYVYECAEPNCDWKSWD